MAWQFREKQILISCLQTVCSLAAWSCAWSSNRDSQKSLSMPTVLRVHLLQQTGKISASRWEEEGWKCKGQFIIVSVLAGHQDWTPNKLCQDICSELASLAVLHKQKSAGVQHVERLPNRVINLYKQKNLPKKHISSHCTPGYKAELSCKLIHISCLLQPQRRAQATYRGESTETEGCALLVRSNGTRQIYSVMMTWYYFFLQQQCKLFKDGHILKWLGSRNMFIAMKILPT